MRPLTMVKVTLLLAVSFVMLGRAPGAWACSCVGYPSEREALEAGYESADLVFAGEARSSYDANAGGSTQSSGDPVEWTFDVDSTQKGPPANTRVVFTARFDASCGFAFTTGRRYQVFANEDGGHYSTGVCTGTHVLASGEKPFVGGLATTGVGVLLGISALLMAGAVTLVFALRMKTRPR